MRKLDIKKVTNMEDLHCYNYYKEDKDYSERDEIKMELQNEIIKISSDYEFGVDCLVFEINNKAYVFYACDEFITLHIVKGEEVLIETQNPNEIIEYVKMLNNSEPKIVEAVETNWEEYVLFVMAYDFGSSLRELFHNEGECDLMYGRCVEFAKEFENSEENKNLSISQYTAIELFLKNKLTKI